MHYPPHGLRGFAATPAQTDFRTVPVEKFIESNNRETLCVIQIERREALENLDEMLSFPGVDVACLGYMDLSVDMGIPGEIDHPQIVGVIERLIASAQRHGLAAGIIAPDIDPLLYWMQKGMRFVSYATESAAPARSRRNGRPPATIRQAGRWGMSARLKQRCRVRKAGERHVDSRSRGSGMLR